MVMVRFSRFTYGLMEAADTFTVSLPRSGKYKELLAQAGTLSGRDMDRGTELNTGGPGPKSDGPVIDQCGSF